MDNLLDIVQGSDSWRQIRAGRVTASRVADVVAKTKSGPGASRATYMGELIAERLTGVPAEKYTNATMAWGTEKEPEARAAYEMATETWVSEVGFVLHPTIEQSGASPDGLAGEIGLVEIKCPNTSTHIETLLGQNVPGRYVTQIQWQLACTGRAWCDFISFDPRLPETMRLFTRRVDRDGALIASLEAEVRAFLDELDEKVAALTRIYGAREAA